MQPNYPCSIVCLLICFSHLVFNCSYNVQIWQTWFHHQHVSPFSHIPLLTHRTVMSFWQVTSKIRANTSPCIKSTHHSSNGKSSSSRRQLIAASVPKCRFGLCSISVYKHSRRLEYFQNIVALKSKF